MGIYGGNPNTPCDMHRGPCACGAWHGTGIEPMTPEEIEKMTTPPPTVSVEECIDRLGDMAHRAEDIGVSPNECIYNAIISHLRSLSAEVERLKETLADEDRYTQGVIDTLGLLYQWLDIPPMAENVNSERVRVTIASLKARLEAAEAIVAKLPDSPTWPMVMAFALCMEKKLAKNRHKGDSEGWRCDTRSELLVRLKQEVGELELVLTGDSEYVINEAADVGNFAMMIADKAALAAAGKGGAGA